MGQNAQIVIVQPRNWKEEKQIKLMGSPVRINGHLRKTLPLDHDPNSIKGEGPKMMVRNHSCAATAILFN